MYVRLGFSIAVTVDPEILLVDEIVAVGDEEFQRKCFDHLHELHRGAPRSCSCRTPSASWRTCATAPPGSTTASSRRSARPGRWCASTSTRSTRRRPRPRQRRTARRRRPRPGPAGQRRGARHRRRVPRRRRARPASALIAGEPATIRMHYRAERADGRGRLRPRVRRTSPG